MISMHPGIHETFGSGSPFTLVHRAGHVEFPVAVKRLDPRRLRFRGHYPAHPLRHFQKLQNLQDF